MDRRAFLAAAAAVPLSLRADTRPPLALVTADKEAAVVLVDAASGRLVRRISTRPGPRSIERVGEHSLVAHTAYGEVTLLEGTTVKAVVGGFGEPRYTAAAPGGRHAFVTDSGRGEVAVLDVLRARVVARVALGGPARHVSIDRAGRTLWVALGSRAREAAIVDVTRPLRPRHVGTIRPPFLLHDVGLVPGTGHVWVTSGDRGTLAVYDGRTGRVVRRLAAGAPPQHVTFERGRAFVTSGDDGTLRVHALADGRVLRETRVPVGSYNVQWGPGLILTPSLDEGTLCVVDTAGRLLQRVRVARSSHDACFM